MNRKNVDFRDNLVSRRGKESIFLLQQKTRHLSLIEVDTFGATFVILIFDFFHQLKAPFVSRLLR